MNSPPQDPPPSNKILTDMAGIPVELKMNVRK